MRTTALLLLCAVAACGNDDDGAAGDGQGVTQVRAGEGLTGGGSGSVVDVAVDFDAVARADHQHAFSDLTGVPTGAAEGASCADGQKVVGIDVSTGKVTCDSDTPGFSPWTAVGANAIRYDGNVGINADAKSALEINSINGQIFVHDHSGGNGASLILDDADRDGAVNILLQRGGGLDTEATIFLGSDNAIAYQTRDGPHRFKVGETEAMRVAANGNVGIANPTPEDLLVVGTAHCDGNTWINASSRRFKEGIQRFGDDDYRRIRRWLDETDVVWYRYKHDHDPRTRVGLIAEDVPAVLATADRSGISTADAIGFLTAAAKESAAENDRLRRENAALESRLGALEKRLAKLERR